MDALLAPLLILILVVTALLVATFLLRHVIWFLRHPFYLLNEIQWFLYNPLRLFQKNTSGNGGRWLFRLLLGTLVAPLYWVGIHILMTPLRMLNAIYFDLLLYWSVMLDDGIQEVFHPKLGSYRYESGLRYFLHWLLGLPWRLARFAGKSLFTLLDSLLMLGISILWPTLTMYHGTGFESAAVPIVQRGLWYVGSGDYVGSGIYFGMRRRVAEHYAPSGYQQGIVIVRITPTFTRNSATLPDKLRWLVGRNGQELSRQLPFPWATLEHWRHDFGHWWEYCIVQPGKAGKFISNWRIRPIAVLRSGNPTRIWGGMAHYSHTMAGWVAGASSWAVLIWLVGMLGQ
ncbi:MAG: hypothetical protein KJ914_09165 [Gammaproteobacteria bacterium]|nr:hypothetical protein [Gammaproteobacteria bacterium]MBU1723649.1 hypothetical protein [Gammaproteobacteria bacterium]MBU2005645.1 hypothetical protein [Gammaproteobacteria bacterium]